MLAVTDLLVHFFSIRNRLTALKKDSSHYIKPQDVQQLYQAVIKQVTRLNAVRDEMAQSEAASQSSRPSRPRTETGTEPDAISLVATNRVDTTLNDVFSLLSLFFLTIGRSRETPATFSQLGCMKVCLVRGKLSVRFCRTHICPSNFSNFWIT
jgi:hypothetical protein